MEQLITAENLIESAQTAGIKFGKSDPYNRLRYYTKMGWLPYMIRKKSGDTTDIKGHYPEWALSRLVQIEKLKNKGLRNSEITKLLQKNTKSKAFLEFLKIPDIKAKIILYSVIALLIGSLIYQAYAPRPTPSYKQTSFENSQILESGTNIILKNSSESLVQTNAISNETKVYITFQDSYYPATKYWVQKTEDGKGFLVKLDVEIPESARFWWWVTK
jgi:DNA-binding transcriptional MerR regulator